MFTGGVIDDITPLQATTNPLPAFSTQGGSTAVTIDDPDHAPQIGDWISIATPVSIDGLILFGIYQVSGAGGGTEYTVEAATPATFTTSGGVVPTYTSTGGSAVITVEFPQHGLAVGSPYNAVVPTTFSGVTVEGLYAVETVPDSSHFTISVTDTASGGATVPLNGGAAQIRYLLQTGFAQDTALSGYGGGDYGAGDYGGSLASEQAIQPMRQWSLTNWGAVLIASPSGGGIYQWTPPAIVPAAIVSPDAPTANTAVFVMSQARMVVALGAEVFGQQQPMLVRWSTNGDYTDWVPTEFNQAGSFTIPQGNRLVGGLPTGLGAILWTDLGAWSMTYMGLPFVFGFQPIAQRCGLLGMRCFAVLGQVVFWLSPHGFYMMSIAGGAPQPVPCSVWDILYNNWDLNQPGLFHMGVNATYNEFELFFPIDPASDLYVAGSVTRGSVKFNVVENAWDYSISPQLQRTAWVGHTLQAGSAPGIPLGTDPSGLMLQHEIGRDDNGTGIAWSWQTADFFLGEGEDMEFVDQFIPDFITLGEPQIRISLLFRNLPSDDYSVVGPFAWSPHAAYIPPFAGRGRQMAILVEGNDIGSFNRLGKFRYRVAADGRGY